MFHGKNTLQCFDYQMSFINTYQHLNSLYKEMKKRVHGRVYQKI